MVNNVESGNALMNIHIVVFILVSILIAKKIRLSVAKDVEMECVSNPLLIVVMDISKKDIVPKIDQFAAKSVGRLPV